jgi:hypothetical protein
METKPLRKVLVATDFSDASDEPIDRPVLTVPYSRKAA